MIGQAEDFGSVGPGSTSDLGRLERSVGAIGVAMELEAQQLALVAQVARQEDAHLQRLLVVEAGIDP